MRVLTKKAAKDYPAEGIRKGDTYYTWTFYRQRPLRSKTYPTRSQLTQNDASLEVFGAYDGDPPETADDVEAMAASVREAAEIEDGKFENMPEGFQQGDAGQRLEERRDAFNEAADALDEVASTLREEEEFELGEKPREQGEDEDEDDEVYEEYLTAYVEERGVPDGEYFEFEQDEWTWTLNKDSLQEAVNGTEPDA